MIRPTEAYRAAVPAAESAPMIDSLDRLAIGYITAPLALFLAGWLQWWAALPLLGCMAYSLRAVLRRYPAAQHRTAVTRPQLIAAIAAGCAWTVLGGADHLAFANADWHIRDAVLHDLVVSPWPVGYGMLDGGESILRAPVAFYLPAALVGKWLGLHAAHVAMGLWTATGATLFLLQVLSLTPSRGGAVMAVTAVVIFFSGLDIVGSLLNDGPRFRYDWNITTHLEWWAGKFQYSSMTTQLFWVPNHALAGWLGIGMLFRNKRSDVFNSVLPIVVVAAALWSPLTALGLVPFVLLHVAVDSAQTRSLKLLHPRIWAPAALIGIVTCAYLVMDPGRIPKGLALGGGRESLVLDLLQQAQFFLLEAGFVGAAILAIRPSAQVVLAMVVLAFLPLVYLGPGNDLVMRASIPSLAVLTVGACLALAPQTGDTAGVRKKAALVALLLIGAVTPIEEIARSIFLPAWPINLQATLIGASCGSYAPHYVARLEGGTVDRMLRPAHRIPLGPQGPAACANPALELMWSWSFFPRDNIRPPKSVQARSGTT
jgi:hypothetical protein